MFLLILMAIICCHNLSSCPLLLTISASYILLCHCCGRFFLQVTGHRLQVTGHRLQVTGCRLQVTSYRLQVTGYRSVLVFVSGNKMHESIFYFKKMERQLQIWLTVKKKHCSEKLYDTVLKILCNTGLTPTRKHLIFKF